LDQFGIADERGFVRFLKHPVFIQDSFF